MNNQQAQQISEFRKKDNQELQQKKKEFFDWINVNFCDYGEITKVTEGFIFPLICCNPKLKSFEMWLCEKEHLKNYDGKPNTRTKVNSETCLETDKIPDLKKAFTFIEEVANSLIRNDYEFYIWFSKGQRSPHIRIYDFEELQELNPKQRIKAQVDFWRENVPFGLFHLVDTGMFVDEHPLQMEYAIHYKTGNPFNLLFHYKPEKERKEYPYPLMFFDGGIKFNPDRKTGKIAYAYVLFTGKGEVISENCLIENNSTTPKAEYKGLILGLEAIEKNNLKGVRIYGDSELIINQVTGKYRCDNESLKEFYEKAKSLMKNNKIEWIPREKNGYADLLTKGALKEFRKSIKKVEVITNCFEHPYSKKYKSVGGDWICPICMK